MFVIIHSLAKFTDHLLRIVNMSVRKLIKFISSPEPLSQFQTKLEQSILGVKGIQIASKFISVWGFRPTQEFFTHMETSRLLVKGCFSFYYARHLWPLSSEGSLACHTYCDTEHPFIMVISEDP